MIEKINDYILKITIMKRFYKNPPSILLRDKLKLEKEMSFVELLNNYNFFTTKNMIIKEDTNSFSYQKESHNHVINIVENQNSLPLNIRQVLEIMYLYSNFPIEIIDTTSIYDSIHHKDKTIRQLSESEKYRVFTEAINKNYQLNHQKTPIIDYYSSIAHIFNIVNKNIEIKDNVFHSLIENFCITNFDVPLEQVMEINIGRKNYCLVSPKYDFQKRLDTRTYKSTLDNLEHNINVCIKHEKMFDTY